jgi:tetratricopeptide (TPR) repeat protein
MAKSKARPQRKPPQQLPGIHREKNQRLAPNQEFQVELSAERRDELIQLLLAFVNAIPKSEREFVIKNLSSDQLREMLRRSGKNLNPDHMIVAHTVSEIWRAPFKYDVFLLGELVKPFTLILENNFDERIISNPSEEQFYEIIEYLGKMWSRAAVYALITHLSLVPMPAQAHALEFVLELEKRKDSEPNFDENLSQIEFASEDLIAEVTNDRPEQSGSPTADGKGLPVKDAVTVFESEIVELQPDRIEIEEGLNNLDDSEAISDNPIEIDSDASVPEIAHEDSQVTEIPDEYTPVQPEIVLADIDELVFTPLGQMLIRQAIASADGNQIGALSRDEYATMLNELSTLNNAHMPTWFQIGFSSALGLVEPEFKMDSAALNSIRRYWHLWGVLKGLLRTGDLAQFHQICDERWTDVLEMFKNGLASELLLDIARVAIYQNVERAENLLGNFNQIPAVNAEQEMALIQMLDSESVLMLRNSEAARAILVLEIAQNRLIYLNTGDRLMVHEKSQITDLFIRISMGMAACFRATNDFETAVNTLWLPDDFPVDQLIPRTLSRLYIQQFLSASRAKRIEDVELPRSTSERKAFKKHYQEHSNFLHKALDINERNADANYLLAGIMLSEEKFDQAASLLGRAILYYGQDRKDRDLIKPRIKLLQVLLKARSGDLIDFDQAIDEIIELAPRLQKEEFSTIVGQGLTLKSSKVSTFLSWAVRENLDSTLSIPASELSAILSLTTDAYPSLVAIASRLSKVSEQIDALIELLENSLSRQNSEDIESTLAQIDELRKGRSPIVHKRWAELCLNSEELREYINAFDATLSALVSLSMLDDKQGLVTALLDVLDTMLPIEDYEAEGNFQQLLEQLQEIAPEYLEFYHNDPRTKAPLEYAGWAKSPAAAIATETSPIRVFFVGGNPERQSSINEIIKPLIQTTFGSSVEVEFFESTWSSTWYKVLDQIQPKLDRADVVVLSPLVRTTFGQTLRRKLNDSHIPRISCTSEGKSATLRSIQQAVSVAEKLRNRK